MTQPIDSLLEIEKKAELYNYRVLDGTVQLWPMIRFEIIFTALYEKANIAGPYDPFRINYSKAYSYFKTTIFNRSSKVGKADFVFFGNDISNIKVNDGYFNRLTEYFAEEYANQSVIIEQSSNFSYKRPRTFKRVYAHDDILIKSKLLTHFSRLSTKDTITIKGFVEYLKNRISWSFKKTSFWADIEATLIRLCKEFRIKHKFYKDFLEHSKPIVVFLEAASYGYANLSLIVACKEKGIKLVEYQHGMISLNHPAYNYHKDLHSEYQRYLPDFFLSYGDYWKENCRLPIPIVVIGNPYLTQKVESTDFSKKENQLLYASGAVEPEVCVKNVLYLSEKLSAMGYRVLFRPHPSEVHRLETIYEPIRRNGIAIDTGTLHESLSKSKYVFSDFSTVLFESLAFHCTPLVLRTPGSDMNINCDQIFVLDSVDTAVNLIQQRREASYDTVLLWKNGWKIHFRNFINDAVGTKKK